MTVLKHIVTLIVLLGQSVAADFPVDVLADGRQLGPAEVVVEVVPHVVVLGQAAQVTLLDLQEIVMVCDTGLHLTL